MQSLKRGWSATVGLLAAMLASTVSPIATAQTMADGPAGKLPLYEGEGAVGFDIYHGGVSRWEIR